MSTGPDRLALLRNHPTLNGIDFVTVGPGHDSLLVHFVNPPGNALIAALTSEAVTISPEPADGAPAPALTGVGSAGGGADRHLVLSFAAPGPFSPQRLTLTHTDIDPWFGTRIVDFKAGCPSAFDCRDPLDCPPGTPVRPRIDYTARDFQNYRRALLDYAATHWPQWQEDHLPDAGQMVVDLMAYMGGELAYYQDRVARETTLENASQPRSVRAHARLMDYEIAPALGAHGLIEVQVDPAGDLTADIPEGTRVWALTSDGIEISYEVGFGLPVDPLSGQAPATYPVDAALNAVPPYLFDEDEICLPRGSTVLHVQGALEAALPLNDQLPDGTPFRLLLLRTDPELGVSEASSGAPEKRLLVRAVAIEDDTDPLTTDAFTRITLAEPVPVDLDLETLTLRGNLVPISAGTTRALTFVAGRRDDAPASLDDSRRDALLESIEREGPLDAPLHRLSLPDSAIDPLVWLSDNDTTAAARPVIELAALDWDGVDYSLGAPWTWRRSLMGAVSSLPDSLDYTLEDGTWDVVRRFVHLNLPFDWRDYAGPLGSTLRFGDGEFGAPPPRGTLFQLRYKTGGGVASNLGAGTLRHIDMSALSPTLQVTLSNPFALTNGRDAEDLDAVRRNAPEEWKVETFRAVRPEDFTEAAERLDWVDRANTVSRWTGSWQSTFTTPDPANRSDLSAHRRAELDAWLDKFRLAGRDARVADTVYADLDLEITICTAADRERSDVARRVRRALSSGPGGFFDPNARSFGETLERARLEAAIHAAGGVRAVEQIRFRRRGWFDWRDLGTRYAPEGSAEIIRVDTNPVRPERGTVTLLMEGGA